MNLICFPPYGGGGLVCDLLNGTQSPHGSDGTVVNPMADQLKIPIPRSFKSFRPDNKFSYQYFFEQKYEYTRFRVKPNTWVGTHCFPDEVDTSNFSKVIVISTENLLSKIYRFMRVYFMYDLWAKKYNLQEDKTSNLDYKLKSLDLKLYNFNYHQIIQPNTIQLEIEDIVHCSDYFKKLVTDNCSNFNEAQFMGQFQIWKSKNVFLYDQSFVNKFIDRYKLFKETEENL